MQFKMSANKQDIRKKIDEKIDELMVQLFDDEGITEGEVQVLDILLKASNTYTLNEIQDNIKDINDSIYRLQLGTY